MADMKTLYLLDGQAIMRLDGEALRVSHKKWADQLVPLRRIARAVIKPVEKDLMQACMAVVARGGVVHLQDGKGNICAVLQSTERDGNFWAEDLATRIAEMPGSAVYDEWRRIQQRHAWSKVFRKDVQGGFERCQTRLMRYLMFFRPELRAKGELKWLEQQLLAWTQAQLVLSGYQPVVRALHLKGERLDKALLPCLMVPLLWRFVRWRRMQSVSMVRDRTQFFEMCSASTLRRQLECHLDALNYTYEVRTITGVSHIFMQAHRVLY